MVTADRQTWAAWRWFGQYHPNAGKGEAVTYGPECLVQGAVGNWPPVTTAEYVKPHGIITRGEGFANQWLTEFRVLFKRSITNTRRDPILTRARFFSSVFPAIICGLIFLHLNNDQRGVQAKIGGMFFFSVNQCMMSLMGVTSVFPLERPLFLRETQNGYYRVSTYYLSKTFSDLPFQIIFPVIFCTIVYWMMDLRPSATVFFEMMFTVVLGANVAVAMGWFIACIAPSPAVAGALGPVAIFPLMMLCGFFTNTSSIPIGIRWLESLSFFKYMFHNNMYFLWHGVDSISCVGADMAVGCKYQSGADILKAFDIGDQVKLYAGILIILMVGWRILAYLVLVRLAGRSPAGGRRERKGPPRP